MTEREAGVIAEIDAIHRRLNPPDLSEWPGLPWRAINDRLLRIPANAGDGNAAHPEMPEPAEDEADAANAAVWAAAPGYRAALTFVLHLADASHFAYDEGILRALHYMIAGHDPQKKPGRWRRGTVWVRTFPSGDILYATPPPKLVPGLIAELIARLNERSDEPAIIRAAMAHLNIAAIHPFTDGNGRMSRALHTLVLARSGITAPPFASIDEYLSVAMGEYDKVLRQVHGGSWQPERDARPWIRFCLTAHYYQAVTLERRSLEYDRLWEALESEVAGHGLPERAVYGLAEAALVNELTAAGYESAAGVAAAEAGRDLNDLVDARLLAASRENGRCLYVASDRLKGIRDRTRAPDEGNLNPFAAQS